MRAGIILAALTAVTIAAPQVRKRDIVIVVQTETDIVWVTQVVTVTADPVEVIVPLTVASATSAAPGGASGLLNHDVNPFPTDFAQPIPPTTYAVLTSPTSTTRAYIQTTSIALQPPVQTTTLSSSSTSSSIKLPDPVSFPPVYTSSTQAGTTTNVVAVPPTSVAQVTTTSPRAAPTTTSTTAVASNAKPTTYQQLVVAHHNLHRRNHSAPDIVWDTGLANAAASIAASCKYAHNTDVDRDTIGGYGQNIAAGVGADNISLIITELFYNGEVNYYDNLYGQAQPDMSEFEHWGHFSQIVWKDTTKVGCATQHCSVLQNVANNVPPEFTVCNYQSPGNVQGEYTEVGYSLRLPTAHWNYFL